MRALQQAAVLALAASFSTAATAHGFGALYNLPVPFWLYGWGAAATVIVSFLIAGLFLSAPPKPAAQSSIDISDSSFIRSIRAISPALRWAAVFLLLLCVATGFFGNRDPARNFSLTFFWVIFLLLFSYLIALVGNFYEALNPWKTLTGALDRLRSGYAQGRLKYPNWLGDWPALVLYLGFIWFELFGNGTPKSLASFLISYSLLNFLGVWVIGSSAWFRHCEFFSVFMRLVATMAPLRYRPEAQPGEARFQLRWPFAGCLHERPTHLSTVAFVLAMLSTTAFDGLKATQWWVSLVFGDPTGMLTKWLGVIPSKALAIVLPWFQAWESFWLFLSPFIYLAIYLLAISLARALTGSTRSARDLMLDFGYTLLPIALVYHITHYATLILTHGVKIISLASDPFGWKWDLFGTAVTFRAPFIPDMGVVWHSQVGLILFGHIVSLWLAHLVALNVFSGRGKAMLSQLPMLILMVTFTVFGLWIIAQPLTVMLLR